MSGYTTSTNRPGRQGNPPGEAGRAEQARRQEDERAQEREYAADGNADEIVINTLGTVAGRQGILAINSGKDLGGAGVGDTIDIQTSQASATVTASDGDGIRATGAAGNIRVAVNGNVTATGTTQSANGIKASSSLGGNIDVQVANNSKVLSNGATGADGVNAATTGGGNISVRIFNSNSNGQITGATDGIDTSVTGSNGTTTIDTRNGLTDSATISTVTGNAGDGITAFTSGNGLITIDAARTTGQGAASNQSNGIKAVSTGGSTINVTTRGSVTGDTTGSASLTGVKRFRSTGTPSATDRSGLT